MTKEKLIQYCDLQEEIKKLEKRIDKIERQSETVADVVQKGYKRHAIIRGYDFSRKEKLDNLKNILQNRYDRLLEEQAEIENWIDSIERSEIRQIFEHRYIDRMNWIQIQIIMGYNSENTARVKHDRYLEKF